MQENQELLTAFSDSAVKTLKDLCQVTATPAPCFVKGDREQGPFNIGGLIGITSSVLKGSAVLTFPRSLFCKLIEQMLGEACLDITSEHEDAAAELLNIIFGQAKTVLNQKGFEIRMAIPSVLRGNDVYSSYSKIYKATVLPFQTGYGEFYIEFLTQSLEQSDKDVAQASGKALPPSEQAAFFKPFIEGTLNTLSVQCNLPAKPGKPFYKKDSKDYYFDVAGVVGVTSRTVNGSFMMNFKEDVFLKLVGRMLGETYNQFQPGLEDAVSELVNIVLGSAKVKLNEAGHGLQMAIPTVVHGQAIVANCQQSVPTIVIPFESEIGTFHAEINIQ